MTGRRLDPAVAIAEKRSFIERAAPCKRAVRRVPPLSKNVGTIALSKMYPCARRYELHRAVIPASIGMLASVAALAIYLERYPERALGLALDARVGASLTLGAMVFIGIGLITLLLQMVVAKGPRYSIRGGVFSYSGGALIRMRRSIPLACISDVQVGAGYVDRLLGLSRLSIIGRTPIGRKPNSGTIRIVGLQGRTAEALRREILWWSRRSRDGR